MCGRAFRLRLRRHIGSGIRRSDSIFPAYSMAASSAAASAGVVTMQAKPIGVRDGLSWLSLPPNFGKWVSLPFTQGNRV